MFTGKQALLLLILFVITILLIASVIGPIPQPENYSDFADKRSVFGIPFLWNVFSNVLFAAAGFWGLYLLLTPGKVQFKDQRERWPWMVVSIGLILTALGSAYYHLDPDNRRLVLDRLPMTLVFMSFVTAMIVERIHAVFGLVLWPFLLFIGFWSVFSWYGSELQGQSDLRFYLGVQLFTILVLTLMLFLSCFISCFISLLLPLILFLSCVPSLLDLPLILFPIFVNPVFYRCYTTFLNPPPLCRRCKKEAQKRP